MNYFKILNILEKGNKDLFGIPVTEQRNFLSSLREPSDDIDRSFLQYSCQNFFVPKWKILVFNILSFLLFFPLLFFLTFKRVRIKQGEKQDAVCSILDSDLELIPKELNEKYKINNHVWDNQLSLSFIDWSVVLHIMSRYFMHFYFVLKCMINIAKYSTMIKKNNPRAIIDKGEYSFSSSMLTYYCHKNRIIHINVMHGEKLYNIHDSFFHFDECYVWNEYYKNLLIELRAEPSQFIVSTPSYLKMDFSNSMDTSKYADYKYYLAIYNEDEIKNIVSSLQFVREQGKSIKFRPHPRHSDIKLLEKYVDSNDIEYPNKVSIVESVANLEFAVGSYTTVLLQAYSSGRKVILDDVTFKIQYQQLSEMKYILADSSIPVLSQFQ